MSVFTISNRFLDPYDPFWICRTLALKMGTVAILLFLCNAFLMAPSSPVPFILTTIVGTAASEMLPTHSKLKKLGTLFSVVFILAIPSMLFGLFSYFKLSLFLLVISFTYFALRFMAINPKTAAIPVMMITWGLMQLAGGAGTNLNAVGNNYFYFVEFALVGAITVLFFPNFAPNIFKSAFIRVLENDAKRIGTKDFKNSEAIVLGSMSMMRSKLPLLPETYQVLYESIIKFQHECTKFRCSKLNPSSEEEQRLVSSLIKSLILAVSHNKEFSDMDDQLSQLQVSNQALHEALHRMIEGYDQCLA